MRILMALLLPPVAVLMCGKPGQFVLNLLLCCLLWIPGIIHALLVVSATNADDRTKRLVKSNEQTARAIERQTAAQLAATQAQLRRDAVK
jgi:uncharacterized membrane protein YqaE (UPF0057 family)